MTRSGATRWRRAVCIGLSLVLLPAAVVRLWPAMAGPAPIGRGGGPPLVFEANAGQTDSSVRFVARPAGATAYFTAAEVVLSLALETVPPALPKIASQGVTADHTWLRIAFLGASAEAKVMGGNSLRGKVNYLIGDDPAAWRTNLSTYGDISYLGLYPGIDLRYEGDEGSLKGTYTVSPGTNPTRIRWRYQGAERVEVAPSGDLNIRLPSSGAPGVGPDARVLTEQAPVAWQDIAGQRHMVTARFQVGDDGGVGFSVGDYEADHELVIDPTLAYSTYLGGAGTDEAKSIAVDPSGAAYVTGATSSLNFPSTAGAFAPAQPTVALSTDAFVTKLSPDGSEFVYSTYLGGGARDSGRGIAVDPSGSAYVTGETARSPEGIEFPTASPYQGSPGGRSDAFLAKLSSGGSQLVYSTFLGGSGSDRGSAVAIDSSGNAFVAGSTIYGSFPTTESALQPVSGSIDTDDAFLSKFSADGSALDYSTYLGGTGVDRASSIAVDHSGSAYIAGDSNSAALPTGSTAQPANGGGQDGFIAKLNPAGSELGFFRFLGGAGSDEVTGIAVDAAGTAVVSGKTASAADFPVVHPLQPEYGGGASDGFVAKVSPGGSSLVYSTYLGGSGEDAAWGVATDDAGSAYLTGSTDSCRCNGVGTAFPTTSDQRGFSGNGDAFVTTLTPTGSALIISSYLGGSNVDTGRAVASDDAGNMYVAGETSSGNFPISGSAGQRVMGDVASSGFDAFVTKIADAAPSDPTTTTPTTTTTTTVVPLPSTTLPTVPGVTPSSTSSTTSTAPATTTTTAPSGPCEAGSPPSIEAISPAAGQSHGGTEVVIKGRGLCDAASVSFGGLDAAAFRIESATEITAVSPPQPTGTVAVVRVGKAVAGSPSSEASKFRYYEGDWRATGAMHQSVWRHTASLIEGTDCGAMCGKVLLAGGILDAAQSDTLGQDGSLPEANSSTSLYSPHSGVWDLAEPLREARAYHSATVLPDGDVLVTGGTRLEHVVRGVPAQQVVSGLAERYDAAQGGWSLAGATMPRWGHTATRLSDGRVLVVGGSSHQALASAELYDPRANAWTPAAAMATARRGHTATLLKDGRVLIVGGLGDDYDFLASAEIYQPGPPGTQGTWSVVTSLRRSRVEHTATLLRDGRVLVAGGSGRFGEPASIAAVELYNPESGAWSEAASMPSGHKNHAATRLPNGQVLITGGGSNDNGLFQAEGQADDPKRSTAASTLFDPKSGVWLEGEPMSTPRGAGTATLLANGSVLAAGGHWRTFAQASAEVFGHVPNRAPAIDTIDPPLASTLGSAPVTISGIALFPPTSVVFGDGHAEVRWPTYKKLVVAPPASYRQRSAKVSVGTPNGTSVPSLGSDFRYTSEAWATKEGLQSGARYLHTTTLLDPPACQDSDPPPGYPCGKVLVAGGTADDAVSSPERPARSSAELYNPDTGRWTEIEGMPGGPRFDFTATLLADGRVLIAGGRAGAEAPGLATALLYDPVGGAWAPTSNSLSTIRFSHTATMLSDGRVLVVGGTTSETDPRRVPVASTDVFDPVTNTWTAGPSLAQARQLHSATMLSSGRVLVAGGLASSNGGLTHEALKSAEIFEPTKNSWRSTAQMAAGRFSHSASFLNWGPCGQWCGSVLVAGGWDHQTSRRALGEGSVSSAEAFDPVSETWRGVDSMNAARGGHSATLLADGTVLVAGSGFPFSPTATGGAVTAERFDPKFGTWEQAPDMDAARGLHGAVLLDGPACRTSSGASYCEKVLLVGGAASIANYRGPAPPLASAELYIPAPTVTGVLPGTGPSVGSTQVVVTGTGFEPTSTVTFDGIPATEVRVELPNRLVAVSPRHAPGPVEVGIVNKAGTSAHDPPLLDHAFTYTVSGVPAQVTGLVATAVSDSKVILSFNAPSADGNFPGAGPPAQRYVVKQSATAFTDDASFAAAESICPAEGCSFVPPDVGAVLSLEVKDLAPATLYHYAVAAVNDFGQGRASVPASTSTLGDPLGVKVCSAANAVAGQVAYRSGYSLVGLPAGTVVPAQSPLYGWADLGAGGAYSTQPSSEPVSAGRGYWAWFACPSVVEPAAGAESATMDLGAYHASMVGNPSATSPARVNGHDFAARWDPSLNAGAGGYHVSAYREAQKLGVGEGLWAFNYQRGEIRIEATP